jgi:hypothetical protein
MSILILFKIGITLGIIIFEENYDYEQNCNT